MTMIFKTNLGELGIGSISGHHHDNYGSCQLDIFIQKMAKWRGHNKIVSVLWLPLWFCQDWRSNTPFSSSCPTLDFLKYSLLYFYHDPPTHTILFFVWKLALVPFSHTIFDMETHDPCSSCIKEFQFVVFERERVCSRLLNV